MKAKTIIEEDKGRRRSQAQANNLHVIRICPAQEQETKKG
jgi:hypothetical protein